MVVRRLVVDHVGLLVRDLEASRRFDEAAPRPLGCGRLYRSEDGDGSGVGGAEDFGINQSDESTKQSHVAFVAERRAAVDAFYAAALGGGGREKSVPVVRAEAHSGYYAAAVWDPDGNNIEAVYHDR